MSVTCVTGATGYLAAHIIKQLLERGHKVRGTVRSLTNEHKLAPLRMMVNSETHLELVEADLLQSDSFNSMMRGCSALVHTATPVEVPLDGKPPASTWKEANEQQIAPAVDGTRDILRAAKEAGIQKVILTASIASMRMSRTPPAVFNEECWSDEQLLNEILFTEGPACYALAKTLQEKEAWKVAEAEGLNLIVINPALVIGPSLTPHLNFSLESMLNSALGRGSGLDSCKPGTVPDVYKGWVDVREAAQAHVLALENENAQGRYLLQSSITHYQDMARMMRQHGKMKHIAEIPVDSVSGKIEATVTPMDNSKMLNLGVQVIGIEQTVAESVDTLVAGGFIPGVEK